jgi:6-phosphogluconolactonase
VTPETIVMPTAEAAAARVVELFVDAAPRIVALAGGDTPRRVYELLPQTHLDWVGTQVFLTDERCVPVGHPMSNFHQLSQSFGVDLKATIHSVRTDLSPDEAADRYHEDVAGSLPFDFVLLGLGTDGHTASLFPGMDLDPQGRFAIKSWSKETGLWRVSLTMEALDTSATTIFLVTGAQKRGALERLLRGDDIPASRVKATSRLIVVADEDALPNPRMSD